MKTKAEKPVKADQPLLDALAKLGPGQAEALKFLLKETKEQPKAKVKDPTCMFEKTVICGKRPRIILDFDGVIYPFKFSSLEAYDPADLSEPPFKGAQQFVSNLESIGEVWIYTSRLLFESIVSGNLSGMILNYLRKWNFPPVVINRDVRSKPLGCIYIDDHGYRHLNFKESILVAEIECSVWQSVIKAGQE